MKNPTNKDKEEMLLKGISLDELISMKMQEDYKNLMKEVERPVKVVQVKDITKLAQDVIFSKKSVFRTFNKITKTESFITGLQAEGMLGLQNDLRKSFCEGKIKAFISGDNYVEFMWAEIAN